jgi:hypothetical protein
LVFDAGDRDVAVWCVAEPCDLPAIAEINNGLSVIHPALHWAKAFGHERNFLKRATNHGNSAPGNISMLRGEE